MAKIVQINVSDGGVPKLPVTDARINTDGLTDDNQADRKYHGGPKKAVCLWSAEVIHQLQEEGHPIDYGSAGENLTLEGLDWTTVVPGSRLQLGEEVVIEVTGYSKPCAKNAQWFKEGHFDRMSQKRYPGSSRVYAKVLQPGRIRTGDKVKVVI